MAVAIDTRCLALDFIPRAQRELGDGRRFHIHRVSAYATILHYDSEIWRRCQSSRGWTITYDNWLARHEALDWPAHPDNDLDDAAVLYHLHQQAATVPMLSSVFSQSDHGNAATTLTGSALSASIGAMTQGRLLSSFHHYSYRLSALALGIPIHHGIKGVSRGSGKTALFQVGALDSNDISRCIVWAGAQKDDNVVFWQVQVDVVDVSSRRTLPTSRPGKRSRTAFNPFLQVSDSRLVEDTSRGNPLPHARKFNGVRHRLDRKMWVAEMKPPKHKTKQDFGNFKSEVEAAHAADAAFYHYGKRELLNFPDTSLQFLSTRPTAAPGLDEKAKVKFVRDEAKLLLAAIAASSPRHSSPTNCFPFQFQNCRRHRDAALQINSVPFQRFHRRSVAVVPMKATTPSRTPSCGRSSTRSAISPQLGC